MENPWKKRNHWQQNSRTFSGLRKLYLDPIMQLKHSSCVESFYLTSPQGLSRKFLFWSLQNSSFYARPPTFWRTSKSKKTARLKFKYTYQYFSGPVSRTRCRLDDGKQLKDCKDGPQVKDNQQKNAESGNSNTGKIQKQWLLRMKARTPWTSLLFLCCSVLVHVRSTPLSEILKHSTSMRTGLE